MVRKADYGLIQSLHELVELEGMELQKEDNYQLYKKKSREILKKLLLKMEENHKYQQHLEMEVCEEAKKVCLLRMTFKMCAFFYA